MLQAKRYHLTGRKNLSQRITRGGRRARTISSKLLPCEEAPLITSAIGSTPFTPLPIVDWVLVVVTVITIIIGTVVITVRGGGGGVVVTVRSGVVDVPAVRNGVVIVVVAAVRGVVVITAIVVVITAIVVVITAVVVVVTTNGKVNSIIDGPTLGNWHDYTLMIRGGGYARQPVYPRGEAIGDIGSELVVYCSIVETFEESENTRVCGLRRLERLDPFNHNVVVADNLPSVVQLLRCSKVRRLSVGEFTGLHPLRVQDNGERGVGVNVTTVRRELKFAGGHVVNARNITHRRRVARAALDLQAICEGLADTEIDEVVRADEGVCLTWPRTGTIDLLNNRGVQSKGGLGVPVVITAILVVGSVVIATVLAGDEFIVLTGNLGIWHGNNEGGRELNHSQEDERESDALHRWNREIWVGEKRRCRLEGSFFVEKFVKKKRRFETWRGKLKRTISSAAA